MTGVHAVNGKWSTRNVWLDPDGIIWNHTFPSNITTDKMDMFPSRPPLTFVHVFHCLRIVHPLFHRMPILLIFPASPAAVNGVTALASHTTSFPSTPDVLTCDTAPGAPAYGRTLVMVFW